MNLRRAIGLAITLAASVSGQQTQPPSATSTRPPVNNDQTLRPLTPEEIPPNLNFYAMDPNSFGERSQPVL